MERKDNQLTIAALAAQRGLSLKAAWNLVQREGWCWTESAVRGVVVSVPKDTELALDKSANA